MSTGKFLWRGLRNSAFFTTPLPPADQIREILLGARERLVPALVPGIGEQASASRLTPAQQQIWEDLVASLTGRSSGSE
ncbi:MAG TPA: hypothetical protein VGZ32_14565 [Actinocrinis sp.]|uniref:hypothetical protein n=1 Tax=Actinocrinis sp. TaxID=1920516 RepID=UPI002DDD3E7C|nr:hypothetical protein [Actinocrinis sp.]HEV3171570.1 hypothetical protein [Actinocrinis sp.]